jgi:hypothetical protein
MDITVLAVRRIACLSSARLGLQPSKLLFVLDFKLEQQLLALALALTFRWVFMPISSSMKQH